MKINPLTGAVNYLNHVREKDQQRQGQQQSSRHGQNGKNGDDEFEKALKASEDQVDRAVEEFATDQQARANGLSASVIGAGPGLKVVLKDQAGTVVRQFTGEEFLKLRDATSGSAPVPGKILDQKL